MCDPVSASMAVGAVGSVVGAYGTIQASQAKASALKANAQSDLTTAYANELDQRNQDRTKLSSQLAALSGRGVDASTGTPLELLRASASNQEVDALRLRAAGIDKYHAQRSEATATLNNGLITAGGQLLQGGSKLADLGGVGTKTPALGAGSAPTWAGADNPAAVG